MSSPIMAQQDATALPEELGRLRQDVASLRQDDAAPGWGVACLPLETQTPTERCRSWVKSGCNAKVWRFSCNPFATLASRTLRSLVNTTWVMGCHG